MTTSTLGLADFLLARIAEDEEIAVAAKLGNSSGVEHAEWFVDPNSNVCCNLDSRNFYAAGLLDTGDNCGMYEQAATHIARHDPARVLAECEAKRHLVEMHGDGKDYCFSCSGRVYDGHGPCNTLLVLAAIYSDHPDHRQEWKIQWLP